MRNRSIVRGLVLVLALVMTLSFSALTADTIKIGFFAPVTGPAAADGESALNSARLAVELLNNDGGINGTPVELGLL